MEVLKKRRFIDRYQSPESVTFPERDKYPDPGRRLIDCFLSAEGQQIISRYHIPNRPYVQLQERAFNRIAGKLKGVKLITLRASHGDKYHENQAEAFEPLLGKTAGNKGRF